MLISWVPRLQELTSLTLEHGNVLSKVPPEILQHLKGLRELFIFHWAEPGLPLGNADKDFANFLVNYGGSLQSLDVTADGVIGPHTIRALKYHGKTLVSLKIPSWAPEDTLFLNSEVGSMPRLSSVQLPYPKTNDAAIDLTVTTPTFATTQQVEDEVARWLASCQNLASIKLQDWPNALKILKVIAGEPGINLRRIEIQGTVENPGFDIYKLLNSITSLRELVLGFSSDWDGGYKPSKLSGLGNLRVLDLPYLSEGLEDGDICTLPDFHKHLEKLSIGCTLATDEIWKSLVKMKRLRTIAITGFSQFTKRGILGWLKSVQDIEKGPVQLEILASTGNGLPTGGPALGKLKTPFLKEKGSMLEIQAADGRFNFSLMLTGF